MIPFLTQGLFLGFTAVIQPGPFQVYLLSQTLKNGWQQTIWSAFAPLISDGPIIILVLLILTQTPDWFLNLLQLGGGFFLLYLAYGAYRAAKTADSAPPSPAATQQGILKAALMNALSPGPYIFWATISGPIFIEGWRQSPMLGISFMLGFYLILIGGLAAFIFLFALMGQISPRTSRGLGYISAVALLLFGFYQLKEGVSSILQNVA